jgi:hypothetical protein
MPKGPVSTEEKRWAYCFVVLVGPFLIELVLFGFEFADCHVLDLVDVAFDIEPHIG